MNGSKKWVIKNQDESLVETLASSLDITKITAKLLINRGYTDIQRAKDFIDKSDSFLYDPFLMKDMDKAVERIESSIEKHEKITIYGDYDVDGVTSVSVLYMYLDKKGACVEYYIPSRDTDGYGLNNEAVKSIAENGTKLIITVDNGITAIEETKYIKSLDMDIVITDHHQCREELPGAYAVVDPQRNDCRYPFKSLAGVGVAFKLICAMELASLNRGKYDVSVVKDMCRRYIDLVTIGTIADVMPLVDENRIIVYMGLSLLQVSDKPGIKALFEAAGIDVSKKITSSVIGFSIAPRINAAGRISNASRAVKLLLSDSKEEAEYLAEEFCIINKERQDMETAIFIDAIRQIEENKMDENDIVLVLSGENWHHGVIGIVSSRITEKYNRPSIIISFDTCKDGEKNGENIGKGSARSIKGLNMAELLSYNAELLEKYGGHELAAGLSIKRGNIESFRKHINEQARNILGEKQPEVTLEIDAEIDIAEVNVHNIEDISLLEPFGSENPQPLFSIENAKISDMVLLSGGKHTKIVLSSDTADISALFFGVNLEKEGIGVSDIVSVAGSMNINEFRGERTPQFICRDINLVKHYSDEIKESRQYFESIMLGKDLIKKEDIPVRAEFASVYKFLLSALPYGSGPVSIKRIAAECDISYIKIFCIIHALYEGDIIKYDRISDFNFRITIMPTEGKSDLTKTEIMKKILNQYR